MTTAMTKDEFRHAVRRGLGRAVTAMRADPLRYRDTLAEVLMEPQHRTDCTYDMELLSCLPEPEMVIRQNYERILQDLEKGNGNWRIPLLVAFGFWEELQAVLEKQYDLHYRQVIEYLKSGSRTDGGWVECIHLYQLTVFQLTNYKKASSERIRRMLWDLADLYDYAGDFPVPEYLPVSHVSMHMEKAEFDVLLAEVAARHRNGRQLLENGTEEDTHWPDPPKRIADLTLDDILDGKYFPERYGDLLLTFADADEDLVRTVAEHALKETDPARKYRLLALFAHGKTPPAFPLSPEILIELAEQMRAEDSQGPQDIFLVVLDILRRIRHPLVREYSETLLRQYPPQDTFPPNPQAQSRIGALWMRYEANYGASDRAEFAALLNEGPESDQIAMRGIFLHHIQKNTPDLPMEHLENLYCRCHPGSRGSLVHTLLSRGELPDWMREECRYDSNPEIRRLVKAHMSEHEKTEVGV